MELKFTVQTKINKPVSEVFDAVVDPKKLNVYFTTGGASAPLKEGTTVQWSFGEFPDEKFPVIVTKVVPNKQIVFEWDASEYDKWPEKGLPPPAGYKTRVEMVFESLSPKSTLVKITESGWRDNQNALNASYGNCGGWMHMSMCLKAYLEHGINLRKDSF